MSFARLQPRPGRDRPAAGVWSLPDIFVVDEDLLAAHEEIFDAHKELFAADEELYAVDEDLLAADEGLFPRTTSSCRGRGAG